LIYGVSKSWSIPMVGAHVRDHGFVGGTDSTSDYAWDVFGGVGYSFNDLFSAFAGYRVLKIGYRSGNFIFNVVQPGPVLGLNVRF